MLLAGSCPSASSSRAAVCVAHPASSCAGANCSYDPCRTISWRASWQWASSVSSAWLPLFCTNRAGLQQHQQDALGALGPPVRQSQQRSHSKALGTRPTCALDTAGSDGTHPASPSFRNCSPMQWVQQHGHSKRPSTPAHLCSGYSSTVTASARSSAGSGRGSRAYCSAMPALTREARTQATLAAKKKLAALRLAADPFLSMALTWQMREEAEVRLLAKAARDSERQKASAAQPAHLADGRQAMGLQDKLRDATQGCIQLLPH